LDEELAARALFENLRLQLTRSVELVIARENDGLYLFLLIAWGHKITANDLQPAIALPHLFPQIARAVTALRIGRIALCTVIALVEGQESRRRTGKLRGHVDLAVADRKVDHRPAWKGQAIGSMRA
jgi:hypothetical protein